MHFLLIGLALFLALVAAGGLVYLRTRDDSGPKPSSIAAQAATALLGQNATAVKVTYFDQNRWDVTGELTVAKGGDTTGTLTDAGSGGKADYLASGKNAVVRGDQAWWARRDPARIGVLQDNWVRPDGYAFPMNSADLAPESVAGLIDWVRDGGTAMTGVTSVAGEPVVGMRRDEWTMLFTSEKPYRLVWFGGRLQDGAPIGSLAETAAPTPPYLSVLMNPPPDDAEKVELPADAVTEQTAAAKLPSFDVTVNATTCRTVNCSWTVTVKNVGAAPGDATVIASVAPGMTTTEVKAVGKLQPGDSVTTPAMTFPNPAPTNKDVTADYRAQVYAPELHGANLDLMRQLQEKGLMPGRSPILSKLDPSQIPAMLFTLDAMAGAARFDPDKAIDATVNAVTTGVLPEVGELVRSRRVENPSALYTKLQNPIFEYDTGVTGTPVTEKTGSRRQLQIAADVLHADPDATVTFDSNGIDLLVRGKDPRPTAIQTRSITSDSVAANVRSAVKDLEKNAPSGSRRVIELYVDAPAGYPQAAGRDYFDAQFAGLAKSVCPDGADEIVVVNQAGPQRWNHDQITGC
ncbi:hypothetical protein Acy02nite_69510 [Actinoplanes cyaneus]|uniref:Uncharacterized protein n=1 Tax=Actinoplanes cyaneus TaxID=52696 RepID=A0A919IVY6_9ACTN|nr:hypothetical protein [Actinoplanes cyaneus]MCW2140820.1 hypothetical protein [Actinoplanes cyaneus]GID69070.1 hypothetical protein Acy02nite_69510 [Actinoplanes cyaneus]